MVATAGGNSLKIWDLIGGGKMVYSMESHNKTVTSICVGKVGKESGGGFAVTHSMRFPAPLMSIGFSPDCMTRVIGSSNGIIFAGRRKGKEDVGESKSGNFWALGSVEEPQRRALRPTYFSGKNPENVVAVMEEMVARRKLLKCVVNLDEEELGLLLGFLHKHSTMPRHSGLLMGLTKKVLEMRADDIRASDALKSHIRNLKRSVEEEIRIQHSLQEIQGIISPLLRIAGRR
ncbi:hypothetical protein H0E87_005789 [Populus deltoides]|uniref:U3 small nucleolar RNA-associated protein 15 C-terminal domain-containing protein n=1 Tax=Populus deltoides TaxID=3696 RepID=A0A8T2ZL04_POPDE|nr:hypothetical protein H0E87_005789 [Populus deltoides]